MSTGAMRRAQLVSPFGVGAMSVLVNGTSVITAGLDHWYEPGDDSSLSLEEYQEPPRRRIRCDWTYDVVASLARTQGYWRFCLVVSTLFP